MASVKSFETTLKEVVTAKRLSASKISLLTDIALNCMEHDTELVSILYRTHKTLGPASKIHSLYAFDALARAARGKVNKLGLTGDINSEKGNCATFLRKMDGVLDGLIRDMTSLGTTEAKEKTKKILDIWTKNNTFPPSVLNRLAELAKDAQKKDTPPISTGPPTDPRVAAAGHSAPTPTQSTPPQVQPAPDAQTQTLLQAILSSAAVGDPNASKGTIGGQTGTNMGTAGLPANQVVLLQQLVERAKAGSINGSALPAVGGLPQPAPVTPIVNQPSVPTQLPGFQAPSASYNSPPQNAYGSPRESYGTRDDRRQNRWDDPGPSQSRHSEDWQGRDRGGWRGGPRGGSRGGRGGGRFREDDRDGARWRRSRSRSPPRPGAPRSGRDIRPYSPPRRSSLTTLSNDGKDEFGREVRTKSPITPTQESDLAANSSGVRKQDPRIEESPKSEEPATNHQPKGQCLEDLDFTQLDFSTPAAWETLGKAWHVTHGVMPEQNQLMQYVMAIMAGQDPTGGALADAGAGYNGGGGGYQAKSWKSQQQQQPQQQPGRSIPTYESGSNLTTNSWHPKGGWQGDYGYDYEHGAVPVDADTDAVVLGGSEESHSGADHTGNSSSTGGGMKQIGGKWVWQS